MGMIIGIVIFSFMMTSVVVFCVWHFMSQSKGSKEYKGYLESLCKSLGGQMLPRNPRGYTFNLDHKNRTISVSYSQGKISNLKKAKKTFFSAANNLTIGTEISQYGDSPRITFRYDSGINRKLGRKIKSGDILFDQRVYVFTAAWPNPDPLIQSIVSSSVVRQELLRLPDLNVDWVRLGRELTSYQLTGAIKPTLSICIECAEPDNFDPKRVTVLLDSTASIASAIQT